MSETDARVNRLRETIKAAAREAGGFLISPAKWATALVFAAGLLWILAQVFTWGLRHYHEARGEIGEIIVNSPTVYTRERLVNDRFHEVKWLSDALKVTNSILSERNVQPRIDVATGSQSNLEVQFHGQSRAANPSSGPSEIPGVNFRLMKPPDGDESRSSSAPPPVDPGKLLDVFHDVERYRDEVRQELLRLQLDDRHDIAGNSLYQLNFDTAIISGLDTDQWAVIHVRVEEKPLAQDYVQLYRDWYRNMQEQATDATGARKDQILKPKPEGTTIDQGLEQEQMRGMVIQLIDLLLEKRNALEELVTSAAAEEPKALKDILPQRRAVHEHVISELVQNFQRRWVYEAWNSDMDTVVLPYGERLATYKGRLSEKEFRQRYKYTVIDLCNPIEPIQHVSFDAVAQRMAIQLPANWHDLPESSTFIPCPSSLSSGTAGASLLNALVLLSELHICLAESQRDPKPPCPAALSADFDKIASGIKQTDALENYMNAERELTRKADELAKELADKSPDWAHDKQLQQELEKLADLLAALEEKNVIEQGSMFTNVTQRWPSLLPLTQYFGVRITGCESDNCKVILTDKMPKVESGLVRPAPPPESCPKPPKVPPPELCPEHPTNRAECRVECILQNNLSVDAHVFPYGLYPNDVVQRVLTESKRVFGGGLSSSGGAAQLKTEEAERGIETTLRVIGFGEERCLDNASPGSSCDDTNEGAQTDFGWAISPSREVGGGWSIWPNDANRQESSRYVLSALLSMPSWWKRVRIRIDVCWAEPEEMPTMKDRHFNDKGSQSKIGWYLCSGDHAISAYAYDVRLPGSANDISSRLGYDIIHEPHIELKGQRTLAYGVQGDLLLEGGRLWRSTYVSLGDQSTTDIEVLPNMEGIVAHFDCVRAPSLPNALPPPHDGAPPKLSNGPSTGSPPPPPPVEAIVWTSEGKTQSQAVQLVPPQPGTARCDIPKANDKATAGNQAPGAVNNLP